MILLFTATRTQRQKAKNAKQRQHDTTQRRSYKRKVKPLRRDTTHGTLRREGALRERTVWPSRGGECFVLSQQVTVCRRGLRYTTAGGSAFRGTKALGEGPEEGSACFFPMGNTIFRRFFMMWHRLEAMEGAQRLDRGEIFRTNATSSGILC